MEAPDRRVILSKARTHMERAERLRALADRESYKARAAVWEYIRTGLYSDRHVARVLGIKESYLAGIRDGYRMLSPQLMEQLEKL